MTGLHNCGYCAAYIKAKAKVKALFISAVGARGGVRH